MSKNKNIFCDLLILLAFLLVVLFVTGCKTLPAVPTPSGTHDHQRDSIRTEYVHDSIYIDRWHKEYQKGDTVFIHDSIFRDRWHNRDVHDSVYISMIDTIYQTVQIEKKGSAFLRNSGIALWVLIGLLVLAVITGIVLKFAK